MNHQNMAKKNKNTNEETIKFSREDLEEFMSISKGTEVSFEEDNSGENTCTRVVLFEKTNSIAVWYYKGVGDMQPMALPDGINAEVFLMNFNFTLK